MMKECIRHRTCAQLLKRLAERDSGQLSCRALTSAVSDSRSLSLGLSATKALAPGRTGILWMDLEHTTDRYLLTSALDGSVAIYDTLECSSVDGFFQRHEPVARDQRGTGTGGGGQTPGHRFSASSCCWYPVDTGMFVTGSFDDTVKLWDTNVMAPACEWNLSSKVYSTSMSPLASAHGLIAAGCHDNNVRLCDLNSGGFSHTLIGHQANPPGGVWSVAWSKAREWQLFTGGSDGRLLAWDIRRAGVMWRVPSGPSSLCPSAYFAPSQQGVGAATTDVLDILRSEPLAGLVWLLGRVMDEQRTRPLARRPRKRRHLASTVPRGVKTYQSKRGRRKQGTAGVVGTPAGDAGRDSAILQEELGLNLRGRTGVKAVAHSGKITGIETSADGHHLLTAGTDSRVRLWDTSTGDHLLVNYPDTFNAASKARRICLGAGGRTLYHPSGSVVQVYGVQSGEPRGTLRGHYATIHCCEYNPSTDELYSADAKGNICVWTPPIELMVDEGRGVFGAARVDEDNWSD